MRTAELTGRAVLLGMILGVVFGMANAYLSLRVGMTISASIPAAVMSMAILRGLLRRGTILENSLVQTIASSGEALAAGVIFTVPAFLFLKFPEFFTHMHIFLYTLFGGLLGVCFLIPLRKFFVEEEAKELKFPEGTACAEILKAGDAGGAQARWVFGGLGLGGVYKFFTGAQGTGGFPVLWESATRDVSWGLLKSRLAMDLSPALLGVGYIIGLRTAAVVFAGGAVGWYFLMPLITYAWGGVSEPLFLAPEPISNLNAGQIWSFYIRYIGAGAVLAGGFITLFKTILPVLKGTLQQMRKVTLRVTESGDLPMGVVLALVVLSALGMWLAPIHQNLLTVLLSIVLGFLFSAVSGRMTGIVGSSSNPISGMTIASLAVICGILYLLGYRSEEGMLLALSAGVIVCITASMAGDAAQDLKTGQLVGNRPWVLQIGEFIGFVAPVFSISYTLMFLHHAFGLGSETLSAPQATIISLVIKGIFQANLPWELIFIGVLLAVTVDLLKFPTLAFAVGLYLPITTTVPILIGGIIARLTRDNDRGVLLSSGLVAGDALVGILVAGLVIAQEKYAWLTRIRPEAPLVPQWLSFLVFLGFAYFVFRIVSPDRNKMR
ncbi:MAG: OPT family oligopeptide transporter [bacterium JZ-2024 1]